MFLKIGVSAAKAKGKCTGKYTISFSSSTDELEQKYDGEVDVDVREDLLEVREDDKILVECVFIDEGKRSTLQVPVSAIEGKTEWVHENTIPMGLNLSLSFTIVDRAPSDWFEKGLVFLEQNKPWYLCAEDLYTLVKYMLADITVADTPAMEKFCTAVDYATMVVARDFFKIDLEEGYSLIARIDDLVESLLQATDAQVDRLRFDLAVRLQKLRRALSQRLLEHAQTLQEIKNKQEAEIRQAIHKVVVRGEEIRSDTLDWAQQEKELVLRRFEELKSKSVSSVEAVQQAVPVLLSAPLPPLESLPPKAHPYIHTAVATAIPYVTTAAEKIKPYWETVRAVPLVHALVEELQCQWSNQQTKHEEAWHKAENIMAVVSDYCLQEDYYAQPQQQEVTAVAVEPQEEEVDEINQAIFTDSPLVETH